MIAVVLFVNAIKGISTLQLSRDLKVQYETTYVLANKLCKALLEQRELTLMHREIDMDRMYVHPVPRKANRKVEHIDYRLIV
ncbi:hypothetical protein [Basilea psittacipulmonis]|nr:hypothetical protein [Basilea psittacipulmonis]